MLRAVSVIGPRNEPLFFRRFLNGEPGGAEDAPDLRYHFMCHSALDVLEERKRGNQKALDMFQGLLCPMEEYLVYAYLTNTQLKVLAILEDAEITVEESVLALMRAVHTAIQRHVMNPFSRLGEPITSPRFAADVARAVATYNDHDAEGAASAAYVAIGEANLNAGYDDDTFL
mmetsp:Transcript_38233/g.119961  ORF Transcript_38233/g.119961 Transcript_38233/m.119961 type:complete len:173 (-) Transcript_38233:171-689(-)